MQNAGIAALGLNWRYLAFDTLPERLGHALAGAKAMSFIGLNLTVPHKLLAMELVDELDESAKTWGAVNTVRFEAADTSGAWRPLAQFESTVPNAIRSVGFNTDAPAIARSLREDLGADLRDTSALVLGAGGAGRVTALKLAAEGVRTLFLVNRTAAKADEIAATIRERYKEVEVKNGYPSDQVDLVVNATSLGLKADDPLPFDESMFSLRQTRAAYDLIYRPAETRFLSAARLAGCRVANGLGMLLYQGAQALELWSGRSAPLNVMRRALQRNVYEH